MTTITYADIIALCAGYDPQTLALWYAEVNAYRWPEDCPVPKPPDFDDGFSHIFWDVLNGMVDPMEASRAHWLLILGKTEDAWRDWWDAREAQRICV